MNVARAGAGSAPAGEIAQPSMLKYLAVALAGLAAPVAAQVSIPNPSQLPPGQQLERQSPAATIQLPATVGLEIPEGAAAISVKLAAVTLRGDLAGLPTVPQALLPAPGQQVTLDEIYRTALQVQQHYLDAGFPLVRVFVPVQNLNQDAADISISVVAGYIARIDATALPARTRTRVTHVLQSLVNRRNATTAQIERAILLAGDTPGLTLSSALAPGDTTGETVLILSGDYRVFDMMIAGDNRLAAEFGRNQVTGSLAFNNLFGQGERIGLTAATAGADFSFGPAALRRYAGLSIDLPIGTHGLQAGMDTVLSSSRLGGALAQLQLESQFIRVAGRLAYPLVRNRQTSLQARLQFDANSDKFLSLLLGFPVLLSRDETRVLRAGINGSQRIGRSMGGAFDMEYSHGLAGLGARSAQDVGVDAPLSRVGADALFNKLVVDVRAESGLFRWPAILRMTVRGQSSFGTALVRSEQFAGVSNDLVSGPPSGTMIVDQGVAGRTELVLQALNGRFGLEPYLHVASAFGWLEQATALEQPFTRLFGAGAGLRATVPLAGRLRLSLQAEFSQTNSNNPSLNGQWASLQAATRF